MENNYEYIKENYVNPMFWLDDINYDKEKINNSELINYYLNNEFLINPQRKRDIMMNFLIDIENERFLKIEKIKKKILIYKNNLEKG